MNKNKNILHHCLTINGGVTKIPVLNFDGPVFASLSFVFYRIKKKYGNYKPISKKA